MQGVRLTKDPSRSISVCNAILGSVQNAGILRLSCRRRSSDNLTLACGGRGKHSRLTPDELVAIGERVGFDGGSLATASRLVAKVDSAAVQDGFDLYLHGFIVTDDGHWVVVQQGMNG